MEGSLSDAISAVSTMEIVTEFKIPFEHRRGRTYLLCPGHDDQNFGSCYVDKNDDGYYCYACDEHVSKWDMLLKVSGFTHASAANWFFEKSGITPSKFSPNPLANIHKLITKLQVFVDNSPTYDDIYDCKKLESTYGRTINGDYLFSELTSCSPLLDLYRDNKELFKTVVLNVLNRKKDKLNDLIKSHRSFAGIPSDEINEGASKQLEIIKNLIDEVVQI